MGVLGRYIDGLSDAARDRIIEAQAWCVAELVGPEGARCLVGHAEDWRALRAGSDWWRTSVGAGAPAPAGEWDGDLVTACSPQLFAFRRAQPGDLGAYRARVTRWGIAGEALLGGRFDRLCARLGRAGALRLVKARASRPVARPRAEVQSTGAHREPRGAHAGAAGH